MTVKRRALTPISYRTLWSDQGTPGTHNLTVAPLATTRCLLMVGNVSTGSESGAYSPTLTGWTWPSSTQRVHVNDSYAAEFLAIGYRNSDTPGTNASVYFEADWSGFSVLEFPGLKGEIVAYQETWSADVNYITLTTKIAVPERNLLALAIGGQNAGGGGPDSITQYTPASGWSYTNVAYNGVAAWYINPPIGSLPSVRINCSSRNQYWTGAIYLLR